MDWENNAYWKIFIESLTYVLEHQVDLFTKEDIINCQHIKNSLSPFSQYFLSRIILRQGKWHRLDKLQSCLPRNVENGHELLETGMNELIQSGYLEKLTSKTTFSNVWEIISNCLGMNELKVLYERILKIKCKSDKKELLNSLYRYATTTKDLFNNRIDLSKHILISLDTVNKKSPPEEQYPSTLTVVHVKESIVYLLRRIQRLVQISCRGSTLSTGRDLISMYHPLYFNAPMLVHFKKIRFPDYSIETTCPLFQSPLQFHLWEASCELRSCFDEVTSFINRKDEFSFFLLGNILEKESEEKGLNIGCYNKVLDLCQRFLTAVTFFDFQENSISQIPAVSSNNSNGIIDLTESGDETEVELRNSQNSSKISNLEPSKVTSLLLFPYTQLCHDQLNSTNNKLTNKSENRLPSLSLISILTLGTSICFQSYLQHYSFEQLPHSRPSFMSELNAGTVLSTLCWDGVDTLEKESRSLQSLLKLHTSSSSSSSSSSSPVDMKVSNEFYFPPFSTPIQLLHLLLTPVDHYISSRYCHRRSGKYFERLCIDLEQIGMWKESLSQCSKSLNDPYVKGSSLIGFTRRHSRLTQKDSKLSDEIVFPSLPSLHEIIQFWCEVIEIDKTGQHGCLLLTSKSKIQTKSTLQIKSSTISSLELLEQKTPLKRRSSSSNTVIENWSCQICTFLNSSGTWKCKICQTDRVAFPLKSTSPESESFALSSSPTSLSRESSNSRQHKRLKLESSPQSSDQIVDPPPSPQVFSPPPVESNTLSLRAVQDQNLLTDDDIDRLLFHLKEPTHLYIPPVVVIIGRRVGDMRMGKNLLIGPNGSAVTVENLVMQIMKLNYEDGLLFEPVVPGEIKTKSEMITTTQFQHFCGDWIGWHCEGSIVRTLFSLVMWEELFEIPVPNVFQTKYQEAPLDLFADYGLFYLNRENQIKAKLQRIESMSSDELIELIGYRYRNSYRRRCVGISWNYPLSILQICVVSLGSKRLSALCQILCGDYKQFSSGAPDLHMIRSYLYCQCCQEKLTKNDQEYYQGIDWKDVLGDGWNTSLRTTHEEEEKEQEGEGGETQGGYGIFHEFGEDAILQHEPNEKKEKIKKKFFRNKIGKLVVRNLTIEEQFKRTKGKQKRIQEESSRSQRIEMESKEEEKEEVVDLIRCSDDEDEDENDVEVEVDEVKVDEKEIELDECVSSPKGEEESIPNLENETNTVTPLRKDPFQSQDPNITLPIPIPIPLDKIDHSSHPSPHLNHTVVWNFETLFVEVKGPTDRLSDTQQRWIHILNSNDMETVICHVKEGRVMGIAGGYHRTVESD